jgi:Protein of unknown function (DUF3667)
MSSPSPPALSAVPAATASAPPAPVSRPVRCENCGTVVTERYCGHCGQRLEPPVHSLKHFLQVAAEDLTHADSRLWRTLAALLFKPGQLTREFLAGHRARYLPPLRLYLVLSVVFFLLAGLRSPAPEVVRVGGDSPGQVGVKVYDVNAPDRPGETHQQRIERECSGWEYHGPWHAKLAPALPRICRRIEEDRGRSLQEAFLHNVPRAMFVFLPLLAGVMMLMYWRPRHYYVEHLLLFVHNHAFVFLLGSVVVAVQFVFPRIPLLSGALFCYFLWYMYRSMRVVYGQGRALTVGKLALLSLFYLCFATLMLAITTAYSALTL